MILGASVAMAACSEAEATPLQQLGGGLHVVPADAMGISVLNDTTLTITVAVNGGVVRMVPPRTAAISLPASALPALPWAVEARSPTGRLLVSMTVKAGDVVDAGNPVEVSKGPWAGVALSCGRLGLWSWSGLPPPPPSGLSSSSPGDCSP
jgi:hypothetical protein